MATNIEVSEVTVQDVLSRSYAILERSYRTEYVFKNNIATKIYLARQNPQLATLLNEFVVGCSIADLVMLSGRAHVYEIKTKFDSPAKPEKQVADYYKATKMVTVVCDENQTERYVQLVQNTSVGLIEVTNRNTLRTIVRPKERTDLLNINTMMASLRVPEYINIAAKFDPTVRELPNTMKFQRSLQIVRELASEEYHRHYVSELGKRVSKVSKEHIEAVDRSVSHIALQLSRSPKLFRDFVDLLHTTCL